MPLLPVHQCGQAQLSFPVKREVFEELVIFHLYNSVCGNCARTSTAMWWRRNKLRRNSPLAQDLDNPQINFSSV